LLKDILALKTSQGADSPKEIAETLEWRDFLRERRKIEEPEGKITCIILAGGRSTRMSSTIPKPVLPFRNGLLFNAVLDILKKETGGDGTYYAAVGFRSGLVRHALEGQVRFVEYERTLGLAFRVAVCLELLENWEGLVILTYTDMPLVSADTGKKLVEQVNRGGKETFGLMTSQAHHVSGHVVRENGRIKRVIQARLNPEQCTPGMERDVGVYVFHNTPEFRAALGTVRNNNLRGEFILADVVEVLANKGWKIVGQEEQYPDCAQTINRSRDLLYLASGAYRPNVSKGAIREVVEDQYKVKLPEGWDVQTFRATIQAHVGPLYCFSWWDKFWGER
jgi:bifunctional N-acetylglucosamine-1-phosphate-uridyltransferase/glucosamine-1-phosphate-acetyltransferase GlmU-like protein